MGWRKVSKDDRAYRFSRLAMDLLSGIAGYRPVVVVRASSVGLFPSYTGALAGYAVAGSY